MSHEFEVERFDFESPASGRARRAAIGILLGEISPEETASHDAEGMDNESPASGVFL